MKVAKTLVELWNSTGDKEIRDRPLVSRVVIGVTSMKKMIIILFFLLMVSLFGCVVTENRPGSSDSNRFDELSVENNITVVDGYRYEIIDNGVKIVGYEKEEKDVVIPEKIIDKPVKIIGSNAFYQHKNMVSVRLPQNLTTIEGSAFYRCYSLTSVEIPAAVTQIESEAFFRASALEKIVVDTDNKQYCDINGVLFNKDMTKLVAYPEGNDAKSYTVPSSVCEIGDAAFGYHCKNLRELTVHASVTKFPDYNIFVYPKDITLIVEAGSVAESYAKTYELQYRTCNTQR